MLTDGSCGGEQSNKATKQALMTLISPFSSDVVLLSSRIELLVLVVHSISLLSIALQLLVDKFEFFVVDDASSCITCPSLSWVGQEVESQTRENTMWPTSLHNDRRPSKY